MKAHQVQAPRLAGAKDFFPRLDVGGRITGQWKIAAVVCAAEIRFAPVDKNFISVGADVTQAEQNFAFVVDAVGLKLQVKPSQDWIELVPGSAGFFEIHFKLCGTSVRFPGHRLFSKHQKVFDSIRD
jgi:hypothetical protein